MATTRFVFIDSSTNTLVSSGSQTSDDFVTAYQPVLMLGGKASVEATKDDNEPSYEMALISANLWNSIPNISATLYNNQIFTYDGGTGPINVVFDDGTYSFAQMQAVIQGSLVANGFLATDIQLLPNTSTLKLGIQLAAGFSVDLTTSNWYLLGGFELTQSPLLGAGITYGNNVADITNGQDSYLIHCDAVQDSTVNAFASDVVLTYRPTTRPGSAVTIQPAVPVYVPCRRNDFYDRIRVYVTDNRLRPITYRGEDANYLFHIRRTKNQNVRILPSSIAALRAANQ